MESMVVLATWERRSIAQTLPTETNYTNIRFEVNVPSRNATRGGLPCLDVLTVVLHPAYGYSRETTWLATDYYQVILECWPILRPLKRFSIDSGNELLTLIELLEITLI